MKPIRPCVLVLCLTAFCCFNVTGAIAPLTGEAFEHALQAQDPFFQDTLRTELSGLPGCFVTGPLGGVHRDSVRGYTELRVVCSDLQTLERALERLEKSSVLHVQAVARYIDTPAEGTPAGYRGVDVAFAGGRKVIVQTYQQLRFLIWARTALFDGSPANPDSLASYAKAVSHYLYMIDMLEDSARVPAVRDFALDPARDLFAPPPPFVIEGYRNYRAFLMSHAGIYTDFARGLLAFVATDSLMIMLKQQAPQAAYPNKECSRFQEEMKEFFERDGDPSVIATLTPAILDTLRSGEYFFAVGLNGEIRFGRELLREEVQAIESATGLKAARANHAFLFPGEPLLTAGAFVIADRPGARLHSVNAQSGHYFYSNVVESVREDIAVRSNHYLLTLGHFFSALDRLGITYDSILISKF